MSVGRLRHRRCRQAGSGKARNRARARLNWASQGQRWGRCSVRRCAERVSRPARAKNRRLSVLVVTTCSPRPMWAVQRARLWASTWTASHAALAWKRPDGRWFNPTPYFRSRMAFSISAWRRWSASSSRVSVPVGDEAVIAVSGEQGQLGTGRGLHPPDDEPHRRGVGLTLEGGIGGLGSITLAKPVKIQGNRSPVRLGYGLDEMAQALVLADGDGEADIHLAAKGDDGMSVEAAVGLHRELTTGPGVARPPHRLSQEVGGAPGGVGPALPQPGHQHVAGAGGHGQQRVIAPLAGIAVVACPLLGQPVGLADGGVEVDGERRIAGSRPQRPRPGPATRGSPGRVDGRGPTGSCAGKCPGWMAP